MNKLILLTLLILNACGHKHIPGPKGETGESGQKGDTGNSGSNGNDGTNGLNSLVTTIGTSSCSNGGITLLMGLDLDSNLDLSPTEVTSSAEVCNGLNGVNGQDGSDGVDGVDGTNGLDAPPTAFTPVGLVDPCGDAPNTYDEVFLRLSNGTLLASFSQNASGLNTRFSVLVPGSYSTTDGDNCTFSVDNNGVVYNENHNY